MTSIIPCGNTPRGRRGKRKAGDSKQVVRQNKWDVQAYQDVRGYRMIDNAVDTVTIDNEFERGPELVQDVFMSFYQGAPVVLDEDKIDKKARPARQIIEQIMDIPELRGIQVYAAGDEFTSMVGVETMLPAVIEILKMMTEQEPDDDGDGPVGPDGDDDVDEGFGPVVKGKGKGKDKGDESDDDSESDDESDDDGDENENDSPDSDGEDDGEGNEDGDGDGDGEDGPEPPDFEFDPEQLRDLLQEAMQKAHEEVQELDETLKGIGVSKGEWKATDPKERAELAAKLQTPYMKRLIDMIGRMTRFAQGERAKRIVADGGEMTTIELGNEMRKVLPHQFGLLGHPDTKVEFYRKFHDGELLQWKTQGEENAGKGPLVVCVDRSGSMDGDPMVWALAVTEAMRRTCETEGRDMAVIFFDGGIANEFQFDKGRATPQEVLTLLSVAACGGTSFQEPLQRALDIITEAPAFGRADIVLITDGGSHVDNRWLEEYTATRDEKNIRSFGVFIGTEYEAMHYAGEHSILAKVTDRIDKAVDLTLQEAAHLFPVV